MFNLSNTNNLLSETKYLCQKYGLYPQRQSGQNFLISEPVFKEIIKAANLTKKDFVLEIGAGFGTLTSRLAQKVKKVWAIELEKRFLPALNKLSQVYSSVEVIREDVLALNIPKLVMKRDYKIVANLPYNITSSVLKRFLTQEPKPNSMVLLLQKEVAERIIARPGQLSLLAVSVQFYAEPQIIQAVGRENFWPQPKVDSAIIKIARIKKNPLEHPFKDATQDISEKEFFQVVRAGFSGKRKQIHNNLASSFYTENKKIKKILAEIKIDIRKRPQELSLADWKKIALTLKKGGLK